MAGNSPSGSPCPKRRIIVKRSGTTSVNGLPNSGTSSYQVDDQLAEFICPICLELISEAYITRCGHSFCHKCITASLETSRKCPKCSCVLGGAEQLVPNFLLTNLITKFSKTLMKLDSSGNSIKDEVTFIQNTILEKYENLEIDDIMPLLTVLNKRKDELETQSEAMNKELMMEFLNYLLKEKEEQLRKLTQEVNLIRNDKALVTEGKGLVKMSQCSIGGSQMDFTHLLRKKSDSQEPGTSAAIVKSDSLANKRKNIYHHYEDLAQCYFECRGKELTYGNKTEFPSESLEEFNENLVKFSRYSSLNEIATLNYTTEMFNNSSIVSSIEFDKDREFFAIAGVTKRIKVYDYAGVVNAVVNGIHYPCTEMTCNSKISCVSWSPYHKSLLASSDYEGTVTVWDSSTAQKKKVFQEHEKRCWSVDFNQVDTKLIASGSDDARVKLWSVNMDHSVTTLEAKANVCCVKFNPESRYHIAFGSADHCVHYYDLRHAKDPVGVTLFKGHKKAVSYVKFLNKGEIVSASTDSQLRLWDIKKVQAIRSFVGHANEKNFVGLATDGDYVACGSENNALYIYYKGLTKQLFHFKFDSHRGTFEKERKEDDANDFVSAVCWKEGSNVVVAANSQGIIKILELV